MYSGYVLPIQAIAIILLVGTVAALVLARPDAETARPKPRVTSTISLGHPRGMDGEPLALPTGATVARREPRGEMRDGIIVVKDAESYADVPAFEYDYAGTADDTRNRTRGGK
jgi:NADH-quinone oxidoreductase subunit J